MYNSYERKEKFEQLGACDHLGVLEHILPLGVLRQEVRNLR